MNWVINRQVAACKCGSSGCIGTLILSSDMTTSFETISQNITLLTNCIFQSKSERVKKIAFLQMIMIII